MDKNLTSETLKDLNSTHNTAMKPYSIILLLTLIATHAMGQPQPKTDRLFVSPTQKYRKGVNQFQELIEAFQYEGSLEAKRWWTGYYEPSFAPHVKKKKGEEARAKARKKAQEKARAKMDAYEKKEEEMKKLHPCHNFIFLVDPSFSTPYGFSYDAQDTALVYLRMTKRAPTMEKTQMTSTKLKVDVAVYDSIQMLHMLAVYTAVPMNPDFTQLDGERYHFIWREWLGDRYARSHDSETPTGKHLQGTFRLICEAVGNKDSKRLQTLMPTVHELLAHYRTLLLPDVIVDGWELDKNNKMR